MFVPPPGRFSMTTCWPQLFESCSATMRPITSVGPPAAKGTMMRTTRVGHAAARAPRVVTTLGTSKAADAVALNRRRVIITISLQRQCKVLGRFSLRNIAARPCACNKNLSSAMSGLAASLLARVDEAIGTKRRAAWRQPNGRFRGDDHCYWLTNALRTLVKSLLLRQRGHFEGGKLEQWHFRSA